MLCGFGEEEEEGRGITILKIILATVFVRQGFSRMGLWI